jgi:hypothetical protein
MVQKEKKENGLIQYHIFYCVAVLVVVVGDFASASTVYVTVNGFPSKV